MQSRSPSGHWPATERRIARRFDLRVPVEYEGSEAQGDGMTWDISVTGARIENASAPVERSAKVEIRSSFFPGSFEIELTAVVVRVTETGFAVRFVDLGPRQRELLSAVLPNTAWAPGD